MAGLLLLTTGVLSGVFLVPMNALLQVRGNALMKPGLSIAVQSFNENLMSLVLLGVYGGLVYLDAPLLPTIAGFAALVALCMLLILTRHRANRRAELQPVALQQAFEARRQ
jgi:LPLT family lysophospholipid transporter-like MFS transporter